MKATNTHTNSFHLESGECKAGETADFTWKEFQLLNNQGRCSVYLEPPKKVVKKKVSKNV